MARAPGREVQVAIVLAIAVALAVVSGAALPERVFAQRGQRFDVQESSPTTPFSGFPGLFDTYLAPRGRAVLDFPTVSLSYGLSERLTIGTNALLSAPLMFGGLSGSLYARYRAYARGRFAAALTGYGLFFNTQSTDDGKDQTSTIWSTLATANASYYMPNSVLTFSLLGGHFGAHDVVEDDPADDITNSALNFVGVAASLQAYLGRVGFELTALSFPATYGSLDSSSAAGSVSVDPRHDLLSRTLVRALLMWRAGENWLLSGGGGVLFDGFTPFPWLSIAWSPP